MKIFLRMSILGLLLSLCSVSSAKGGQMLKDEEKGYYSFKERKQFQVLKKQQGIQNTIFWSGPFKFKKIALTFDDGPNPKNTPFLLKTLEERNVPVTFFLTGENAERYPALVKEIQNQGHEIGNHSYSHSSMSKSEPLKVIKEIRKTQRILEKITGQAPELFRPPYGTMMLEDMVVIPKFGLKIILWTVDSKDWSSIKENEIVENVLQKTCGGSIIVCHEQCRESIKGLPRVIDALRKRGYEFVTVSELIED